VMLFEMLTGRHPYEGETPISIIIKHVNEPMPRPSEVNPAVHPALDEIVAKATAKSPDERYQRAGEMARALRAALVAPAPTPPLSAPPLPAPPLPAPLPQTPEPVSPVATAPPPPSPLAKTRVWAVLAVALAIVLALAAVLILPSTLSKDGKEEPIGAVPTAQPGETMILIAEFKAQAGSERYDVSQRIYDKLSADLRQLREKDVTVHQVPDVIESSEAAIALGRKYGATTVIWGYYDDIGISPNVEAVGTLEDGPLSVGLERFNLDVGEAVNFKLYIAKDMPEELSFLTAVSLLQAFMVQGRIEKAITYVVMAADNLPQDPQFRGGGEMIYLIQSMMAFLQGDPEEAVKQIDHAIAINPDKALFYTTRGNMYALLGETDRALADVERAIAMEPDNVSAYITKGSVTWWLAGDLEAALSAFDRVIEMEPDEWIGYWGRAIISFEMDDLTMALAAWERVEEIDLDNELMPIARGLIYEKMGQSELAEAEYAQAREISVASDPFSQFMQIAFSEQMQIPAPVYFFLFDCTAHHVHRRSEEAFESCNKALEVDPTYANALWKRGQLYAAQGNLEAAVADYTAAIQADSSWPWVYYLRAQALVELGRSDEAQADLKQALELEPVEELRRQIEALQEDGS
jgi:tetratricopeptide (TPR) repeat protein